MPVPRGYAQVTPYVVVDDANAYARFLAAALGAAEIGRTTTPDGRIAHCEVRIGTAIIMLADAVEGYPASQSAFYLYVDDADAAMQRAINAGAAQIMAVADKPYGDRQGGIRDPAGNIWWVSERLVDEPYYPPSGA